MSAPDRISGARVAEIVAEVNRLATEGKHEAMRAYIDGLDELAGHDMYSFRLVDGTSVRWYPSGWAPDRKPTRAAVAPISDERLDQITAELNAIEALDPDDHSVSDAREEYLLNLPEVDSERTSEPRDEDAEWVASWPGTWFMVDGSRVYPTRIGWTWSR